jgi:hypothetical protein
MQLAVGTEGFRIYVWVDVFHVYGVCHVRLLLLLDDGILVFIRLLIVFA